MNKFLATILLSSSIAFSQIVNGIAITVNEDPITLYDISATMQTNGVDKNKAVGILIDKLLYNQLIKKYNITADVFDTNDYVAKLANANGMDEYAFKNIIKQKYPDYSVFEKEVKNNVLREKLIKKLVTGQLNIASQEDMKRYYEKNINKFSSSKEYKIIEFSSKKKADLVQALRNPNSALEGVERVNRTLDNSNIDQQLRYILNNTKTKKFTPIFTANRKYVALYIADKIGEQATPYEEVKTNIFNEIMKQREKKFLKDFFEKQKLTADIKIIR